jgi:hypothetical protein
MPNSLKQYKSIQIVILQFQLEKKNGTSCSNAIFLHPFFQIFKFVFEKYILEIFHGFSLQVFLMLSI